MIELKGITWDHPRGLAPLLATAARFSQQHPDIQIKWKARSLAEFGEQSIEQLAQNYDLLVVDHPFVGTAARSGCLVPLDDFLPGAFLQEQLQQSVGPSYRSYTYNGHQWALAVDAAAQVSVYRADLLTAKNTTLPRTWSEVLQLAKQSSVAIPLNPAGAIDSFLTLCANIGEPPGRQREHLVSRRTGNQALGLLHELVPHISRESFVFDPPRVLDRMSTTDDITYCPLLFGYSNYSRPGKIPFTCQFTNIPAVEKLSGSRGALLGGTGLAISTRCKAVEEAGKYLQWVTGAECQGTLYFESGGQPGNRVAWIDGAVNAAASNFFLGTLETLEHAYVRPRYDGFVAFHDQAGLLLHEHLRSATNKEQDNILTQIDEFYRKSGWHEEKGK
jgi:multiple sugar transport system substrate-binding protein